MPGTDPPNPYRVVLSDDHWDSIRRLPRKSQQETVFVFLRDHASHTPGRRIPGKLKQLRGEHRGLFQFNIDRSYRLIYRVDEEAREVRVEYIGSHPDWGRRSRGGRRIRS